MHNAATNLPNRYNCCLRVYANQMTCYKSTIATPNWVCTPSDYLSCIGNSMTNPDNKTVQVVLL